MPCALPRWAAIAFHSPWILRPPRRVVTSNAAAPKQTSGGSSSEHLRSLAENGTPSKRRNAAQIRRSLSHLRTSERSATVSSASSASRRRICFSVGRRRRGRLMTRNYIPQSGGPKTLACGRHARGRRDHPCPGGPRPRPLGFIDPKAACTAGSPRRLGRQQNRGPAPARTAPRPKTRYVVGRDAKLQARLATLIPDRWRDGLIIRAMGLRRAPESGPR